MQKRSTTKNAARSHRSIRAVADDPDSTIATAYVERAIKAGVVCNPRAGEVIFFTEEETSVHPRFRAICDAYAIGGLALVFALAEVAPECEQGDRVLSIALVPCGAGLKCFVGAIPTSRLDRGGSA